MVVIQSVIMDEDEDLEALRLAALQTIRPRVNPKKTQHNRQHGKGPFIRPSTNPNLIAIVPSEIAPVPIETTTTLPPPPSVVKPKQESPAEKIPKVVQLLPSTEVKDAEKVDVENVDSIVPKTKPAVKQDESGGFELEEDVLDFDTESLHESGEEDMLQLHDSDSDSLEKLMEDIEKELSTPAPAKIRPPRKQPDKVSINKAKSPPPPKSISTKAVSPPKISQSKPKSPIKIDPKPESPRPAVRENSPVRKRYSPIRQRTGSPIRQRGASPLRQRLASPSRQRMASPRQRPGSPRQRVASPVRRSPRRSPRRRSLSPRKRSLSPRKISPRRRSPSPRRRSPTPRKRSLTPRRRSLSPRRRSLSPRKRSLTPRKRSLSPRKRSISPRRRSITPRRRSLTPRKHSISPRRRSISPRRFSPRRFSPRRPSVSPRRRRSISPRRRSLSPWRSPRRRSPTPKRSPSPLRKRSPSPHHSPNKRKRIQSPPNSKRPRPRQFQRGKQPPATNSNRPGNNPKGGYRGNRDVVDKKEEDRRVKGNSREREPIRSRDRATDTNEDEEKEPEPLNPKLEARKRKFESNFIIEAVNKKIRLKSEREASNIEQNRSENNSGDNTRGMRVGVDNGREEQLRESIARRLDRLEKGRTNRLEKVRNDLSKQDKPRSEPLRLEKPSSVEVSKAEKFRSENSRPDPLPNIVVRASAVEPERESNIKLRTSKRKRIVLSEDKIEEERLRETTRLSENHALKNSTNLRRREVELEEIEEGEEEDAEEEEEEEERVVEKRKRKAPIKEKGGDLRAELSRRRAERMKGVSMDPMARIVQSAFEGVVGKMKSKSRASPPSEPEPVPNPPEKKEKSKPKGRRVFSVSKSSKTEDQSDDEDKTIGFPMHYRSAPNPSSSRTSGRSILRRNQV